MSAVKLIPQSLLDEIERERHRQEEKFPGQVSKCDRRPDWSLVLVEEVSEAIAAAGRGNAKHAREELIQVAAVALRFIEAIDRGEVGF